MRGRFSRGRSTNLSGESFHAGCGCSGAGPAVLTACSHDCSFHGLCLGTTCECDTGWAVTVYEHVYERSEGASESVSI